VGLSHLSGGGGGPAWPGCDRGDESMKRRYALAGMAGLVLAALRGVGGAPAMAQTQPDPFQSVPPPRPRPPQAPTGPARPAVPDLSGVWDVTGENEYACYFERPSGTLTVLPRRSDGSYPVRRDLVWANRAKPGCGSPGAGVTDIIIEGSLVVRGATVVITYRLSDGRALGPWVYRLEGDRMRWQPNHPDATPSPDVVGTTFTYVRRRP
jgi:hypothetical protein